LQIIHKDDVTVLAALLVLHRLLEALRLALRLDLVRLAVLPPIQALQEHLVSLHSPPPLAHSVHEHLDLQILGDLVKTLNPLP
jgi:hypothetical protein